MTRPSLAGIEQRAEARASYADERSETEHDPEEYSALADGSAADVPALLAAVRDVLKAATPHWENQTRREAKFNRPGSACVCEVCDIMRALAARLDLTDPEGDLT